MMIDDEATSTLTSSPSLQGEEGGKGMTLEKLLYKKLYISLRDDREIVGVFICIDRSGNILLKDAEEFLPPPIPSSKEEEVRRNREMFWPKSERYFPHSNSNTSIAGEEGGNQEEEEERERGREIGMVGIKWKDLRSVRISDDDWFLHK